MIGALLIADSGPLIAMSKISRLELLRSLAREVLVPATVWQEVVGARPEAPDAIAIAGAHWLQVRSAARIPDALQSPVLDAGETEALALALESDAACVLMDDRLGRREAARLGVRCIGVVGLLCHARTEGLIPAVAPELHALLRAGYHLSDGVIGEALARVGESGIHLP